MAYSYVVPAFMSKQDPVRAVGIKGFYKNAIYTMYII